MGGLLGLSHLTNRGGLIHVMIILCGLLTTLVVVSSARGEVVAPTWQLTDVASPTVLVPGVNKQARYDVVAENIGGGATQGSYTVRVHIPARFSVESSNFEPENTGSCSSEAESVLVCTSSEPVVPGGFIVVQVVLQVANSTGNVNSTASISGGGSATTAIDEARMQIGSTQAQPGVALFRSSATTSTGESITQAGAHPSLMTTTALFNNQLSETVGSPPHLVPSEPIKDLVFYLPLGMLGNPTVADPCPASIVETNPGQTGCPPSSRVGSIIAMLGGNIFADTNDQTHVDGIYCVQTEKNYAAEFAFASNTLTFFLYASVVRHDGAYMLRVSTPGVPQTAHLIGVIASFSGDVREGNEGFDRGAFLSNPMDCGENATERATSMVFNTWEHPYSLPVAEKDVPGFASSAQTFPDIQGCERLEFSAGLTVTPETTQADAPSSYQVGLDVPQAPNDFTGLATPPVKKVSVTLPEGTTISPSSANGLVACPETGPHGINIEGPESEEIAADGLERPALGHCPGSSQIGTAIASTPLLREQLVGRLYLASSGCGGAGQPECTTADASDGNLFRLYLELEGPNSGIILKLKGSASVDPGTGRITTIFDENPQFPFSNLTVSTKSGPTTPLANSQICGEATSAAEITPWSAPATPPARPHSAFGVDWDGAGGACPASPPFAPSFTAGTTNPVAAATSPFTLLLKREDREQNVSTISTTLPEGLLANVAKATKCPEPQASTASLSACPEASQIGTTTVAVGPGADPYYVTGKVFFTGPYAGAPFGLSVVVPAAAGPFNLGNVLVRVALFIDPHTAQATAVSGPLPQMLDGVPLRLRTLNVTLSDQEFVLNPTSCQQTNIAATVQSTTGASTTLSSPFAVKGCRNLAFKPTLNASTEAKATKADGTTVRIKLTYPSGGEANIAKVQLSFPKQLPVRLETLQKACRAVVFEANPANCPAASAVGTATVHTPILAQPLSGPAYLVSYGNAKFPDVVFVLQGEGVTLEVDGQSQVSQSGVLKVTFESVPDAPFSTFESVLPRGPFSQFTSSRTIGRAQASQCGEHLVAPVTLTAHNGAQLKQNVALGITGCGPSVSIVKARGKASSLSLTVDTSSRGRLTIKGQGLKPLARNGLDAGMHTVSVALTGAGQRSARAHDKVQVSVALQVGKRKVSARKRVAL